ncbi:hypothetical protein [Nocardia testacea]|uniref:DUF7426 family protein n=1 Tax=Nocardia testacea TaxID=248551 RepID=UPI003A89575B
MAALRDLSDFYDPDLLLPIAGVVYRVKCPGIKEADRLRLLVFDQSLTADQEHEEIKRILGPVREQMAGNGVPDSMATHAGRTALLHFGGNPTLGRTNWELGQLGDIADIQALFDAEAGDSATEDAPGD